MRFLLTVLLLVAVVMIVAEARHGSRRRRRARHNRPSLRNVSCERVKNAGVCERCCDPCKNVECCEPLTCSGGECKCNGQVCGDNETCMIADPAVGAICVENILGGGGGKR